MAITPSHPFDLLLEIDRRSQERINDPSLPAALQTANYLAVRLQDWHLLFELDNVAELVSRLPITRIPSAKSWLSGIANLRGTVITVVDLADFLQREPVAPAKNNRIVVVRSGNWHYGLLVDEVIGMRHFEDVKSLSDATGLSTIPHLDNINAYINGIVDAQQQRWLLFDLPNLLNDPVFLNAAA